MKAEQWIIGLMIVSALPFFVFGWPCERHRLSSACYNSVLSLFIFFAALSLHSNAWRPFWFRAVIATNVMYSAFISLEWCWSTWAWLALELVITIYQAVSLEFIAGQGNWKLSLCTVPLSYFMGTVNNHFLQKIQQPIRQLRDGNVSLEPTSDLEGTDSPWSDHWLLTVLVMSICVVLGMLAIGYLQVNRRSNTHAAGTGQAALPLYSKPIALVDMFIGILPGSVPCDVVGCSASPDISEDYASSTSSLPSDESYEPIVSDDAILVAAQLNVPDLPDFLVSRVGALHTSAKNCTPMCGDVGCHWTTTMRIAQVAVHDELRRRSGRQAALQDFVAVYLVCRGNVLPRQIMSRVLLYVGRHWEPAELLDEPRPTAVTESFGIDEILAPPLESASSYASSESRPSVVGEPFGIDEILAPPLESASSYASSEGSVTSRWRRLWNMIRE